MERFRVLLYPAAKRDFMELIGELNLLPPAAALRARGYRCLSVDRYLVLYTISGSDVLLRRILRRRSEHSGLLI